MSQTLEVDSGRSGILGHALLCREAGDLPTMHGTPFQRAKTKQPKNSYKVTYHLEAYKVINKYLDFPFLINMTLKCWLCANTRERIGKGMAMAKTRTTTHSLCHCDFSYPGMQLCPWAPLPALPVNSQHESFFAFYPQDTTDHAIFPATQTHD